MREILICGDILRANLELTHRPYNTRWFSALIRQAIAPLGVKSEVLGHCPPDFSFENFYQHIYQEPGVAVLNKWAEYYDKHSFDEAMSARLFDIFSNKVVILFEGSRSILNYISSIGGVYLNFRVGPLRFASDLIFIIQTNDMQVEQVIRQFAMDKRFIRAQTLTLKAQMAPSTASFTRPTLVFLGQVPGDASLINNGRFASIAIPDGLDISQFGPGDIFHKPHPIDPNEQEIARWKSLFPSSQLLDLPTYAAFCSQGDVTFVTVSSGSGYEAQVLGHTCHFVSPHNWSMNGPRWEQFTPVLFEYWFEGFWRAVFRALEGRHVDETQIQESKAGMTFTPERLRDTINAKWAQPNGRCVSS